MRCPRWVPRALRVLALVGIALGLWALYLARVQEHTFAERKGTLSSVEAQPRVETHGYAQVLVALRSSNGLSVRLALKRPLEPPGAPAPLRPLIVLLGGQETGLKALDLVAETRGTIVAVVGYPYDGPRKPSALEFVAAIPGMRRAILDTPAALQLALDWLIEQPGVDRARIELCGVSLGAPFACVAGALDQRFTRVWSIHGAADPRALLEHSLRTRVGWAPLRELVAGILYVLADGPSVAPERYVGRIAPRPFVMLNAEADERLPREAVLKLFEAAREPKELLWLPGQHVLPKRTEIVRQLVDLVLARVNLGR
jgi:dienelactone hydrolase